MVRIKPFRATILNPELNNRDELICPVYDTINTAQYNHYSCIRNNVIHFTVRRPGMSERSFVSYARAILTRMFNEGILVERDKPALYIYGIRYTLSDELLRQIEEHKRKTTYFTLGLVALVQLEELNTGHIYGHERTYESKTVERYLLMRECSMNFSPVVASYKAPHHELNRIFKSYLSQQEVIPPLVDVTLNGTRHMLWEISDDSLITEIEEFMRDRRLIILDGHHRYSAAYWLGVSGGPAYTLMMLLEESDSSLLLLPWHRCVRRCRMQTLWNAIESCFCVERCDRDSIYSELRKSNGEFDVRVCMYDGADFYLLRADEHKIRELSEKKGERVGLDVISLHEWLIEPALEGNPEDEILFTASPNEAMERVNNGSFHVAFFLKPLRMADIEYKAIVEQKGFPQKSSLFLPKVAEGIVMRRF